MAEEGSMLNTPPTFAWYVAGLVLKWLKAQGGLGAMGERNRAKAQLAVLARSTPRASTRNPVAENCRSWMNVPFTLARRRELDEPFLAEAQRGRAHQSGGPPLGGRHARQSLQRHAA